MATERLSPGVYRVNGKTVQAQNAAQAEKLAGGGNKKAANNNKKAAGSSLTKTQQTRVDREMEVGKDTAKTNIRNLNANVETPFSTTNLVQNPDGSWTQKTSMAPTEQGKYDAGSTLNQQGLDTANSQFGQVYGQPYQFDAAGSEATRARIEDAAYGRLTRGYQDTKAQEMQDMEQTLANRGIPLDPADPQYQRYMQSFNQKWDDKEAAARQQATMLGGQEYQREYDISSGQHNIQTGDLANMTGLGTGFMVPQAPGYQGATIENPSPAALDSAYGQLGVAKKNANTAAAAARRSGSGSSGGGETAFIA